MNPRRTASEQAGRWQWALRESDEMLRALAWRFVLPYRWHVAAVLLLQAISSLALLYLPTVNAAIIDDGVTNGDTATILRLGAAMLVISGVQVLCSIAAVYFGSRAALGLGRDLRSAIFNHVTSFSASETGRFGSSSLLTRTTNDVWHIEVLVEMTCILLVTAPIMGIGGIFMALRQDVQLSWLLLVSVPVLAVASYWIVSHLVPVFSRMQNLIDDLNTVLRDQLSGLRVIRAFTREPFERSRFDDANQALLATAVEVGRWQALILPATTLALIAFLSYFMQILIAVTIATTFVAMLPRASVCAGRITAVLSTKPKIVRPAQPRRPAAITGEIALEIVTFSFPGADRPVLQHISLAARPGATTAIVGSTGSGKSTLLSLICRLYDVTGGSVSIDGIDVREYDTEQLWAAIGLVPQRSRLFSGTIADNLRYGKADAADEEMWETLRIAAVDDFVRNAGGLRTVVAQGGANLSGGQRQRLAIARAVVRRPPIYLCDDAFSALDVRTDNQVRSELRTMAADSTIIIVSQRISAVIDADEVVVIDDGMVVGAGTHESLLVDCPTYIEHRAG